MSESTLNIVVDFSDKSATFTGTPAVGETVLLHITNVPSDVTSSELVFVITDYGDNRLAVCETFTGISETFEGEINLNTVQLLKEFKGLSTRVKKKYPCALWRNSTYNDLIFNDKVSILSNPYPGTGTPIDVSTAFVSFTGTHPADGEFVAFSGTSGTQVKKSGYSASSFATPDASSITSGTFDGDRLPAMSTNKKGAVPATGTPAQKYLRDDGTWAYPPASGDSAFIDLTDVPASYSGQSGKKVAVKATENGLEFVEDSSPAWGAITGTLSSQTDLQSALDAKASASMLTSHINNTSNPHGVTASQIDLGNVENIALSTWAGSSNITTVGTLNNLTVTNTISGSVSGNAGTVTNGVYTSGDQTVAGVKTFSSSPIVPTPTTDMQVATKKYVDDNAGSMEGYPLASSLTSADIGKTLTVSGTVNFSDSTIDTSSSTLSHYWALNDLADMVGGLTGTATDIAYATGINGNASSFNGSSSKIELGSTNLNSGAFSISLWVKRGSLIGEQTIFQGYLNSVGFLVYFDATYGINFGHRGQAVKYHSGITWDTSTWHHIVVTYNGSGVETASNFALYVDGASKALSTYGSMGGSSSTNILGSQGSGSYYNGFIDEFGFWTSTLSSGQASALYNSGTGKFLASAIVISPVQPDISLCQGRLTLESGVAVSTSNQTAKTTLYFTPYNGNQIALYNGSAWIMRSFTETSLSLSGYTADTNYDIWAYDNAGTLTLASTAWTNATTRATALALQNGVYVKSGDATRRYLGTIRTTATAGQSEDSASKRFVWNYYNRIQTQNNTHDTTTSWTYNGNGTYRICNGGTGAGAAWKHEFVFGLSSCVDAQAILEGVTTNSSNPGIAIGFNSVVPNSSKTSKFAVLETTGRSMIVTGSSNEFGYVYIATIETSSAAGSATFYSVDGIYTNGIFITKAMR